MKIYEVLIVSLPIILGPVIDILLMVVPLIIVYKYGKYLGNKKFKRKFYKEINKINLENPYIYYREIPNQHGIGVSAYLLGYNIEYKDVFAAIIDLSAKKYFRIIRNRNKYEIINNNKDTSSLLSNEKYLLDWLISNKTKFDIKSWKELIKNDAINLNLVFSGNSDKDYVKEEQKYNKALKLFPAVNDFKDFMRLSVSKVSIFFVICLITIMFLIGNVEMALSVILFSPFLFGIMFLFLFFFIYLPYVLFREGNFFGYKDYYLKLTDYGIQEYHELYSLGRFLNDFGDIVNKRADEVIIWEQYLSYAILFKINKKLVNSGYEKILINDCFTIDNPERININKNIIVK